MRHTGVDQLLDDRGHIERELEFGVLRWGVGPRADNHTGNLEVGEVEESVARIQEEIEGSNAIVCEVVDENPTRDRGVDDPEARQLLNVVLLNGAILLGIGLPQ